jgi:hypothetical protein
MGSLTDGAEVDVLKMLTAQATTIFSTTALTNLYARLTTTTPTDSAAGTEVTTGVGYAAVQTKTKWGTPSAGSVSNSAIIDFGTATGSWGTVVGIELWDAASAGNRIAWGALTTSKAPTNGDPVSFAIGTLTMTLD